MKIDTVFLKAIIFRQGLIQWQICHKIGLSENYFSKLMNKKVEPTEKLVGKIAHFLKVKPEDLLL